MESLLITSNVMTLKSLTLIEKLVLIDIKRLSVMTGNCKKSDDHWAHNFGVGLATVSRAIKKLEELGLISRESKKTQAGTDRLITLNNDALVAYLKKYRVSEYKQKKTTRVKAKTNPVKAEEQLEIAVESAEDDQKGSFEQSDEEEAKSEPEAVQEPESTLLDDSEEQKPEHGDVVLSGAGFTDYALDSRWSALSLYIEKTGDERSGVTIVEGCSIAFNDKPLADILGGGDDAFILRVYEQQEEQEFVDYEVIPDSDLIDYDYNAMQEVYPEQGEEQEEDEDEDLDYFIEKWRAE